MNEKTEAVICFLAALLVLFSALLDPRISLGLAVAFLVISPGTESSRATEGRSDLVPFWLLPHKQCSSVSESGNA